MQRSKTSSNAPSIIGGAALASSLDGVTLAPLRDGAWLLALEVPPSRHVVDPWPPVRIGYGESAAHPDREAETNRVFRPTPLDEVRYEAYISGLGRK